jgi:hypothetical protein
MLTNYFPKRANAHGLNAWKVFLKCLRAPGTRISELSAPFIPFFVSQHVYIAVADRSVCGQWIQGLSRPLWSIKGKFFRPSHFIFVYDKQCFFWAVDSHLIEKFRCVYSTGRFYHRVRRIPMLDPILFQPNQIGIVTPCPSKINYSFLPISPLCRKCLTTSVVYWAEFLGADPEVRVRFPALPDFLRSSESGTGSTQPRQYNWGAAWKKK